VKHLPKEGDAERDTILVGIDGSPQSFGALTVACELAKKFDKKLELIGVYDPYLHYMVFNSIVDVLNDKAAKVFRFEEQNQLHEEIIDTGLAQIYQSHLEVADSIAREQGVEISKKTLLDGKVFQKILDSTKKTPPWLLVLGRVGVHAAKEEKGLGSNTENLLRLAPCDILLTTRLEYPELDKKAEESILWTTEAEERMTRVPEMVRGIARTGILRLAVEEGHSVITNQVIDKAMDRFMPKNVALQTQKLGEMLAFGQAKEGNVSMCKKCGVSAHDPNPVRCAVCGSDQFEIITQEMVDKIISAEGGSEGVPTYDGRTLSWTKEARRLLVLIEDKYQKRRAKALIEKSARVKKLNTVSREFALVVLKNELEIPITHEATQAIEKEIAESQNSGDDQPHSTQVSVADDGKRLIARDSKNIPLISVFEWALDAVERIFRVPGGFMRERIQKHVEKLALDGKALTINLALVEEAIVHGRQEMEEMIAGYTKPTSDLSANAQPSTSALNEVGILQALERERAGS
jgi:nucleotide-binding universal stress UspA family protein